MNGNTGSFVATALLTLIVAIARGELIVIGLWLVFVVIVGLGAIWAANRERKL